MTYAEQQLKQHLATDGAAAAPATPLSQAFEALEEAMVEIDNAIAAMPDITDMPEVVAEQAKWRRLQTLAQSPERLAAALANRDTAHQMLELLAPALVFPQNTPIERADQGDHLHALRAAAEQYKENLRKLILAETQQ